MDKMTQSHQAKYFPVAHRLLHWLVALAMSLILLTALLRMGWMDKGHMAGLITSILADVGIAVGDETSIKVAKTIRNQMFQWHFYGGYTLAVALILRLIYRIKVGAFTDAGSGVSAKERFQARVYRVFYGFATLSLISVLARKCVS